MESLMISRTCCPPKNENKHTKCEAAFTEAREEKKTEMENKDFRFGTFEAFIKENPSAECVTNLSFVEKKK